MSHRFKKAILIASTAVFVATAGCGGASENESRPGPITLAASETGDPAASSPRVPAEELQPPLQPASVPDDAALTLQVARLRREVADLRVQFTRMAGGPVSTAPGQSNSRTDPGARAETEQAERLRLAASESAFRNEPNDTGWSRNAAASVRAALQGDTPLRGELRSVECRSRSCRVELGADPTGANFPDLPVRLLQLAQTLPNLTATQVDQGDGRKATVLYLSR